MKKEIVVNVGDHEIRIALIEDDKLVELHVERPDEEQMLGDIYKGTISAVLPGMQAAFIDIGMDKAAFLHASDIRIASNRRGRYELDLDDEENDPEIVSRGKYEHVENILSKGHEIMVQIMKEPFGTKGPRVTSDISLPGRFTVLAPDCGYIRVSKRITNVDERKRLRQLVNDVKPDNIGIIVRTEGEGRSQKDFKSDIRRLAKIWSKIRRKQEKTTAPELLHKEEPMTSSVIRDVFTTDVDRLVVDNRKTFRRIVKYVKSIDPALKEKIELYSSDVPIFDIFDLEREIDKMLDRKVWIKKGASIVIDQTEALVTVDVNTGRSVGRSDPEELILQTNLEAAKEAARQIRLRDIGGLLIVDFIDMYSRTNRRKLFEVFKRCFANDRAKNAISPVSDFGLVEMTRERTRPSILYTFSEICPTCNGFGRILSKETVGMKIERWFRRAKAARAGKKYEIHLHPSVAAFMRHEDVDRIREIEKMNGFKVKMEVDDSISPESYKVINADEDVDVTALYQTVK